MHLPFAWQWFSACRDFNVSLQSSCKRRNQRQPRRCHTTADRLVCLPSPIPHPETQLKIAESSNVRNGRKPSKQIERCVISSLQIAESIGFKGEFVQWENLLRIGPFEELRKAMNAASVF
jgi:hypothetical protein